MSLFFKRVAVVGVGLIGGSVARDLRARRLAGWITGCDEDAANLATARSLGIVDAAAELADAVRDADLVLLATPPARTADAILAAAVHAPPDALLTDVCSVKRAIVDAIRGRLPGPGRFVPGHPVAGTEKSGAAASLGGLFEGRRCILTPAAETDPAALARIRSMWEALGARVVVMDALLHDRVCAAVSHLPHAAAYALTGAIGAFAERWPEIYGLGAGGFVDTTRIASSHPRMWRDIFLLNQDAVLEALDGYLEHLLALRRLVLEGDAAGLEALFARMREVRARALEG